MTRIEQMIQYCESENIYWFSDSLNTVWTIDEIG